MECLICRTKFIHASWGGPAEDCDCGANFGLLALRESDEPVNLDVLREAWRTTCERCLEDGKRSAGRWSVEHGAHLCDSHETSANEAAHERMVENYYGGSAPFNDRERNEVKR